MIRPSTASTPLLASHDDNVESPRKPPMDARRDGLLRPLSPSPASSSVASNDRIEPVYPMDNSSSSSNDSDYLLSIPLAWPLQLLYGCSGWSLALPSTALLYMINTHFGIPVAQLPLYGALAFLPYSLKPLYAVLTKQLLFRCSQRPQNDPRSHHRLLAVLLVLSGAATAWTATLPAHAVTWAWVAAGMRGWGSAWPEFLLGQALLEQAATWAAAEQNQRHDDLQNRLLSSWQAQAATARNVGSLLAQVVVLLVLSGTCCPAHDEHHDALGWDAWRSFFRGSITLTMARGLLWGAAVADVFAAMVAMSMGYVTNTRSEQVIPLSAEEDGQQSDDPAVARQRTAGYLSICCDEVASDLEESVHRPLLWGGTEATLSTPLHSSESALPGNTSAFSSNQLINVSSFCRPGQIQTIIWLQLSLVLLTLRQPLMHYFEPNRIVWPILAMASLLALAGSSFGWVTPMASSKWPYPHRVATFLVLRNAVPSVSYLMDSYVYTLFANQAVLLPVMSLLNMTAATWATWSYRRIWSKIRSGEQVLFWTTVLAGCACFSNLVLVRIVPHCSHQIMSFVLTVLVRSVLNITQEYKLLSEVILATTTAANMENDSHSAAVSDPDTAAMDSNGHDDGSGSHVGIAYASLLSCIDYGAQVGALAIGPLVSWTGTTRQDDGHWTGLEVLIPICSCLMLLSAGLTLLIR